MVSSDMPPTANRVLGIEGRMAHERERTIGMSTEERAWRARWLKDQVLAVDEPIIPPDWYKKRYNIIRRTYRYPMDKAEKAMASMWNPEAAFIIRGVISRVGWTIAAAYGAFYYFKYNRNDWTRRGGWRVLTSRDSTPFDDPNYPNFYQPKPNEFNTLGFENSPI